MRFRYFSANVAAPVPKSGPKRRMLASLRALSADFRADFRAPPARSSGLSSGETCPTEDPPELNIGTTLGRCQPGADGAARQSPDLSPGSTTSGAVLAEVAPALTKWGRHRQMQHPLHHFLQHSHWCGGTMTTPALFCVCVCVNPCVTGARVSPTEVPCYAHDVPPPPRFVDESLGGPHVARTGGQRGTCAFELSPPKQAGAWSDESDGEAGKGSWTVGSTCATAAGIVGSRMADSDCSKRTAGRAEFR